MRRVFPVLLSALVAACLLFPTAAMAATATADVGTIVVATEAGGEDAPGTHPPAADSTDNPNPPPEYEAPFLQNSAKGLLTIVLLVLFSMGALYYLMVERPKAAAQK